MKKLTAVLLCAVLLLCFSGCDSLALPFGPSADYRETVRQAVALMDDMESTLFKDCDLALSVWYNTIHQKKDKTTDRYIVKNGRRTNDFNVALDRLYHDKKFASELKHLDELQQSLRTLRHSLANPPKQYALFNETLTALAGDHITLTCVLMDLDGSYNDLSEQIGALEKDINDNTREFLSFEKELSEIRS